MAEDYYPFDSGIGANSAQGRWARMARLWAPSGVVGPPNTTDYQLSFNGLTATIGYPAGDDAEAWVRGFAHRLHTSSWSQPVPANSASQPLIERIVLRRDLAAQTVTLMRLRGNPATTPTPPALLREEDGKWDAALWQYRVPGGSGTVVTNVIDERTWLDPGGDGLSTVWQSYTPIWTAEGATTQPSIGNGTLAGRFLRLNDTTGIFRLIMKLGSTTGGGNGTNYAFSLPPGWILGGTEVPEKIPGWFKSGTDEGPLTGFLAVGGNGIFPIRADNNNALIGNGLLTGPGQFMSLGATIELG